MTISDHISQGIRYVFYVMLVIFAISVVLYADCRITHGPMVECARVFRFIPDLLGKIIEQFTFHSK